MPVSDHIPALSELVETVRFYINEASIDAKYTDPKLWRLINLMAAQVMTDVRLVAENPITVRFTITLTADKYVYGLPPYVGEVLRVGSYSSDYNTWSWLFEPRSRWNPLGPGIEWLGQGHVRITAGVIETNTAIDIEFIPNGEVMPHASDALPASHLDLTDNKVKLVLDPTVGQFDRRPNAYLGQVLRIYDGPLTSGDLDETPPAFFPIAEHIITAYDSNTLLVTVEPDLASWYDTGSAGLFAYEIVPVFGKSFMAAVALKTAVHVLAFELPERLPPVEREYHKAKRALLLSWSNVQSIVGRYMQPAAGAGVWSSM